MKMKRRRFLSFFIAVMMITGLFNGFSVNPKSVFAYDTKTALEGVGISYKV